VTSTDQPLLAGLKVLVVDDNEDTCDLVTLALEMCAVEVSTAHSAQGALKILQFWQPDVIVSDIAMPAEDGYFLIEKIRSSGGGASIPAIALTAYAHEADEQRVLAAGFQKYLAKPIAPQALIAEIADLIKSQPLTSALTH
jgi:CheY-like chemotaxis protein